LYLFYRSHSIYRIAINDKWLFKVTQVIYFEIGEKPMGVQCYIIIAKFNTGKIINS